MHIAASTVPSRALVLALVAPVLAASLPGCGDDGVVDPGEVSSIADFMTTFYGIYCERQVRCGGVGASEVEACRQQFIKYPSVPDLVTEVQAKRLVYDSGAGAVCLNSIAGAACDDYFTTTQSSACQVFVTGAVAPGGVCYSSAECAGGVCDGPSGGCAGKCVAYAGLGADCGNDLCDHRLTFCDRNHKCAARLEVGAECTSESQCRPGLRCLNPMNMPTGICGVPRVTGQPCRIERDCAPNLYCTGTDAGCQPLVAQGGACLESGQCLDNLACVGVPKGANAKGTCMPWSDLDRSCSKDSTLASTGCPETQRCDAARGTCVPIKLGDECASLQLRCGLDGICDQRTRMCVALVPYGGTCDPSGSKEQCDWGNCDPNTRKCSYVCN